MGRQKIQSISSHQNLDEIITLVKQCFPKALKFQVLESSIDEGEQGNLSDIIRLTVDYEEDEKHQRKFLIVKVPKNNELVSAACSDMNIFSNEIFIYDTIIPRIGEYLNESLTPFHYKTTTDSQILILENLTKKGYQQENHRQLYGFDQCLPALKALAHFHATTHKAAQMDTHLLTNGRFQHPIFFHSKLKGTVFWEPIFAELLARRNASHLIPKLKNANQYLQQNYDELKSKFHYSNFKFYVLTHGDYRNSNLLLKTGSNGVIDGVRIIDFQMCLWSSPVYDVMYFFILSTKADVIDNHYETLLDWYLQCLNEKLEQIDCTERYRKPDFMEDLRSLRICTIFHINMVAGLLCNADRDKLVQTISQGKKENAEHYKRVCLDDELFTDTISSISLNFMTELDYSNLKGEIHRQI